MEMAYGSYETMDQYDWAILNRIQACIMEIAVQEDTAIVLPLAMKGHIDHFIVREAGVRTIAKLGGSVRAMFYFAEDKPYAGLLNDEETQQTTDFIEKYRLEDVGYPHHPEEVLKLAFAHYPSQVDDVYHLGIAARDKQLKEYYGAGGHCDRMFKFKSI
jgi:hypothetical protein